MPFKPKIYSIRPMDFAFASSVTSEATGHPIEKALDHNLDPFWRATSTATQDIVLDLNYGTHERIFDSDDRDMTAASGNWTNNNMTTFVVDAADSNVLEMVGDTSEVGYLEDAAMEDFVIGDTYIVTYDYTGTVGGFNFQTASSSQNIGVCVVGTGQTITFTNSGTSGFVIIICNIDGSSGTLDNVSIRKVGSYSEYGATAVALWIRNYNTEFGATHGLKLDWSEDNSNWTEQADVTLQGEMTQGIGFPLRIYTWSTAAEHRYWRFRLHDATIIPDIGQMFLLSTAEPGNSNHYPEANSINYGNRVQRLPSRRLLIEPGFRTPLQILDRSYRCFSDEARDAFLDSYDAARAGATPIILNEGSLYYVCRYQGGRLQTTSIDHQVHDIPLQFETLPYIADGDVT